MAKTRKDSNAAALSLEESSRIIGKGLNFGAAEAYKLLRANLAFSFPEGGCKVVGVTSSVPGEAKSTTSANLAYTLAEAGKRVLLLEGDMRLPTLGKRLKLKQAPGLSNLLVGQCSGNDVLQGSGLLRNLQVITAGSIPPNPSELLSSDQMETTLRVMRDYFDYIVVDLPPVSEVSDAVTISKFLDGILIAVRENYAEKKMVAETVRQLRFANARILGFVMTCSAQQQKGYKSYYHYGSGKTSQSGKGKNASADNG